MTGRLSEFVHGQGRALAVIVLSFALAGVAFLFQLPIAIFPQTDFPRIVLLVDNGIAPVDVTFPFRYAEVIVIPVAPFALSINGMTTLIRLRK